MNYQQAHFKRIDELRSILRKTRFAIKNNKYDDAVWRLCDLVEEATELSDTLTEQWLNDCEGVNYD